MSEVRQALEDFEDDKTISCIILTGNEKAFAGKIYVSRKREGKEQEGRSNTWEGGTSGQCDVVN